MTVSPWATKEAAAKGGTVVEGTLSIGGQQQFYMEKQTCLAAPDEQGRMILYPATQMPVLATGCKVILICRPLYFIWIIPNGIYMRA